ncbi:MAG: M23 family metallopeptidase [Alphaproteobacteria bacterium]
MAESFYCSAATILSGNVGILIGFGLAAGGFLMLLFQGFGWTPMLLMAAGIFLTAIPGWFESSMDGLAELTQPLSGKASVMQSKYAGRSLSECAVAAGSGGGTTNSEQTSIEDRGANQCGGVGNGGCILSGGGRGCSSGFQDTRNLAGASKVHDGIDFKCNVGQNVTSNISGQVISVGWQGSCMNPTQCAQPQDKWGYGWHVKVKDDNGNIHYFSHLQGNQNLNLQGQRINAGDSIGSCGTTGTTSGPHVDYRIQTGVQANGKPQFSDPCANSNACGC